MQSRRASPLYSPIGCGAALALVVILGLILILRGGIPFSPGPLSAAQSANPLLGGYNSHAEFEGDCLQCHAPWSGPATERCEMCHTAVSEQRLSKANLHGHLPVNAPCQQCHTEHKGQAADITTFELPAFEHDWATDFSLLKHTENYDGSMINCDECHPQKQFDPSMINCLDCHTKADPAFMASHINFYGESCQICHDGQGTILNFNHEVIFPLDGAHAKVECVTCHATPILDGTPNECAGCHIEPEVHLGLFGLDCGRCHTTVAWLPAQLSQHTFPIDHGDQGKVDCQVCHTASYAEYTCYNCHEHEPAENRAEHHKEGIAESELNDCIACHPTGLEEQEDNS